MDYETISGEVIVRTDLPIRILLEAQMVHAENEHGRLRMRAVACAEAEEELLNGSWSDARVMLLQRDEEQTPLFCGVIEKLTCRKEHGRLLAEIEGIGGTVKFDREKKSRSFQNPNLTYKQIVRKVIADHDGAGFIWCMGEERETGCPLIQYQETDWEFLKRLCSHLGGSLFSDVKTGKPEFFFGMRPGKQHDAAEIEITGQGFGSRYFLNGCYERKMPPGQAFFLEGKTGKNWQIGDFILYNRQKYRVYRRCFHFKNGELTFTCYLGLPGAYYRKKSYCSALRGARLEGTVRKTEAESVYMQLAIDKEEGADYAWAWTPETNNLCYCMPEIGTKATLYFPTKDEKDGQAVLSAVENQRKDRDTNTQNREFMTSCQKRIGLYPDRMFLEGRDSAVLVSMQDDQGITLCSNTEISLAAGGNIHMGGERLAVTAPIHVTCRTPGSNIELCRDINFYAQDGVHTVAFEDMEAAEPDSPMIKSSGTVEHWQISYSAMAAVPAANLSKLREEDVTGFVANGSVPKVAGGAVVAALSQVMDGKRESECASPGVFRSMENYTVKGGYALPER